MSGAGRGQPALLWVSVRVLLPGGRYRDTRITLAEPDLRGPGRAILLARIGKMLDEAVEAGAPEKAMVRLSGPEAGQGVKERFTAHLKAMPTRDGAIRAAVMGAFPGTPEADVLLMACGDAPDVVLVRTRGFVATGEQKTLAQNYADLMVPSPPCALVFLAAPETPDDA